MGTGASVASGLDEPALDGPSTRERILAISLGLFLEHGFEKTSLRQIAEGVGVTKAALYYHFPSKEDILLALAEEATSAGRDVFATIAPGDLHSWSRALESLVVSVLPQRRLFLLLERNQRILGELRARHGIAPHERQDKVRQLVADHTTPLGARVRVAASIGALMGVLGAADAFADVSPDELSAALLGALRDLLGTQQEAR